MTDNSTWGEMSALPKTKTAIVDKGMTFRLAFDEVSLCSPSRASFLTGQLAHNHRVVGNDSETGGAQMFRSVGDDQHTFPLWLHDAGYRTALIGKYINGYDGSYVPPGWDRWASIFKSPFQYFNYGLNEDGSPKYYGTAAADYLTDVLSKKAVSFITNTPVTRPFFLYLALTAPHQPATSAPRYASAYSNTPYPRTASWNEADVSDKPAALQFPLLSSAQVASLDGAYDAALRALSAADDAVKAVVDALTTSGKLANTYVIFASDNGFHFGEHRLPIGKETAYEEDIGVPMVVRGPGVLRGVVDTTHMILKSDLAPTILTLANVSYSAHRDLLDGRSFHRVLRGLEPAAPWRRVIPVMHAQEGIGETTWLPPFSGVRTLDNLWVEWSTGERELYDLNADPAELVNLAGTAGLGDLEAGLSSVSSQLQACAAASCN